MSAKTERWTCRRSSIDEVTLERDVACPACCKRRRDRCNVCGGSGTWRQEFVVDVEAARGLRDALSLVLRAEDGEG